MDIRVVYELQDRLHSAAVAGAGLLAEDFRLRRAAEAVKQYAGIPVFLQINKQLDKLLTVECCSPVETLLDTISLVDAVVCTLATVEVKEPIQSIPIEENDTDILVNTPYSVLSSLIEALTSPGNHHYRYVCDTYQSDTKVFEDYRVQRAMVQALNSSYAELMEEWLKESDKTIVPFLTDGFDPKGKKEMVRRVRIMEAIQGAAANSFYLRMLETAEKEVRQELLYALRFDKSNTMVIQELLKKERGKNRQICIRALTYIDNDSAVEILKCNIQKNPQAVAEHLQYSKSEQATELVAEILCKAIEGMLTIDVKTTPKEERQSAMRLYCTALMASIGKCSEKIYHCYRTIFENQRTFCKVYTSGISYESKRFTPAVFNFSQGYRLKNSQGIDYYHIAEDELACILWQSYMINPNEGLREFILELYEQSQTVNLLAAAVFAQILSGKNCEEWIDRNVCRKGLLKIYFPKESRHALCQILPFIVWDDIKNSYVVWAEEYNSLLNRKEFYKRSVIFEHSKKISDILRHNFSNNFEKILSGWCGVHEEKNF